MTRKLRRKDRPLGRSKSSRPPKEVVIVVFEGAVTEPLYIDGYRQTVRPSNVSIKYKTGRSSPAGVVKDAISEKEKYSSEEGGTTIWAVIDVDDRVEPSNRALAQAKEHQIRMLHSNPCFELWALYHFVDWNRSITQSTAQRELGKHIPGYDRRKKRLSYADLLDGEDQAIIRAKKGVAKRGSRGRTINNNPSTDFFELIEYLRKKG